MALKKRLVSTGMYERYDEEVRKYIDSDYAEPVPHEEMRLGDGTVWYLPHHCVINLEKDKVRVVLDCAAKFRGISFKLK